MSKLKISDFWLYRWRYPLGMTLIATLLIGLLVAAVLYVPGGISAAEMAAVERTASLDFEKLLSLNSSDVSNLPFHLLQYASITWLGISILSIKLPSLIGSVVAVVAIYGFLRLWFRRNVAVSTTVIVVVSALFLYATQLGTPLFGYIILPALLLFLSALIPHANKLQSLWFIGAAIIAGLSLYTPLQIYGVIALIATGFIHPHARFVVTRLPKWSLAVGVAAFGAIIVPLVVSLIKSPGQILSYLGVAQPFNTPTLDSAKDILGQFVGYSPTFDIALLSPVYGYGLLLLASIGLYRLFTAKYTAKSYILTIWLVFVVLLLFLSKEAIVYTFVPLIALAAFGLDHLFRSWYVLFPYNPYARVAGLLPLGTVVIGLIIAGLVQFVYGFHYSPQVSRVFSSDIKILSREIEKHQNVNLVVSEDKANFYRLFADYNKLSGVSITSSIDNDATKTTIAMRSSADQIKSTPSYILVDSTSDQADRFYVYTSKQK